MPNGFTAIKELVPPAEMEEAVFTDEKQVREENIRQITAKLEEAFADNEEWLAVLGEAIYQYQKKTVRKMILKDHKRPDGRELTQIRRLAAEVDIIPRVHGSAMFTRGQTQICNVTTLAPLSDAQKLDGLDENEVSKRYMHHYNFPAYSVGETKVSRGPGRREIGHGALAERALLPVLPTLFSAITNLNFAIVCAVNISAPERSFAGIRTASRTYALAGKGKIALSRRYFFENYLLLSSKLVS